MILRLVAVALFDLPQPVILPGLDVVRVGLERALVPDLRDLVVAELAIGIADQIGDVGTVVVAERLELLDRGAIVVAVVDRRIGGPVAGQERGIVDAGLGLVLGFLALGRGLGVGRRRRGGSPPAARSGPAVASARLSARPKPARSGLSAWRRGRRRARAPSFRINLAWHRRFICVSLLPGLNHGIKTPHRGENSVAVARRRQIAGAAPSHART